MCCSRLSSVPLQGVIEEQIQQHVSGFNNWNITKHAQSYLDAFMGHRSDLVYLTAGALASRMLPLLSHHLGSLCLHATDSSGRGKCLLTDLYPAILATVQSSSMM